MEEAWEQQKNTVREQDTRTEKNKKPQPGGSLHFGLKMNQQDWQKADHNGPTDVSTTPLPEALDTNHHVSHVCMYDWR
jgi:hypothetical protein